MLLYLSRFTEELLLSPCSLVRRKNNTSYTQSKNEANIWEQQGGICETEDLVPTIKHYKQHFTAERCCMIFKNVV